MTNGNNLVDDLTGGLEQEVSEQSTSMVETTVSALTPPHHDHGQDPDYGEGGGESEGNPEYAPSMGGDLGHDNTSNQPTTPEDLHKEFVKDVKSFGRASGEGASALPRLALRVIRASADGLLSTDKPKGGGKDDAQTIYDLYTSEDSRKAEHSAGGAKANASKLRQLIAMGCMTTCDAVDVANRTVDKWNAMVSAELKPKPLYAGLVDVARAQCDQDTALTDDAIEEALSKTPAEKSVEKEWKAIQKKIDGLVSGENSAGLKDQSDAAIKISELVKEHVSNFETQALDQDFIQMCIERGYTQAQAEAMAKGNQ